VPRRCWSVHQLGTSPKSRASCVLRTSWTKPRCPWLCQFVSQVGPGRYGGSVVPGRPALVAAAAPSATRRMGHGGSFAPCHPRAMAALPAPCRPRSSNQPWSRSTVRRRPPSASGSRRNWPSWPPSTRGCGGIRGDTPGRRRNMLVGSRSPVASPAQLPRGPSSFGHRTATIVPVLRLGYCFPAVFPLPSDPIIALCTVNKGSGARAQMIHVFYTG
jgi:hypothetical protein